MSRSRRVFPGAASPRYNGPGVGRSRRECYVIRPEVVVPGGSHTQTKKMRAVEFVYKPAVQQRGTPVSMWIRSTHYRIMARRPEVIVECMPRRFVATCVSRYGRRQVEDKRIAFNRVSLSRHLLLTMSVENIRLLPCCAQQVVSTQFCRRTAQRRSNARAERRMRVGQGGFQYSQRPRACAAHQERPLRVHHDTVRRRCVSMHNARQRCS